MGDPFRVLAVTQALWGERIADNVRAHAPAEWSVATWSAPLRLPPVIDDPEDIAPRSLAPADLLLALGEVPGFAQLVPELARRSGATAVILAIDHTSAVPAGLERQLRGWLDAIGVASVFPKPLCSLTESTCNVHARQAGYDDPCIRRFAQIFGRPEFEIEVEGRQVARVRVVRDSACGCARHVAQHLPGTPVDEAESHAGMLHHHYPCLASMNQDPDYHDTLMHVSGHLMRQAIRHRLRSHLTPVAYLRPGGLHQAGSESFVPSPDP